MDKSKFCGAARKSVTVDVESIGPVTLRQLSIKDQQALMDYRGAGNSSFACNAFIIARSVFDGESRVFADSEIGDLMEMSSPMHSEIMKAVSELNGWNDEDSAKNSEAGQGVDSSSASA